MKGKSKAPKKRLPAPWVWSGEVTATRIGVFVRFEMQPSDCSLGATSSRCVYYGDEAMAEKIRRRMDGQFCKMFLVPALRP